MGISARFQEERKRLGLTQEAVASKLGATKRSVINWEGGAALPGAEALANFADAGADVLFVLTGQRNSAQPAVDAAEQVLLDSYRRCKPEAKAHLIQSAALLSAGLPPSPAAAPKAPKASKGVPGAINLTSTHDGAVQVGYAGGKVSIKK